MSTQSESWFARELGPWLEYQDRRNFLQVIVKANSACERLDHPIEDHFGEVTKMIALGKGGTRVIADFTLSRYACYLIVQDSRKQGTEAKPKDSRPHGQH